MKSNSKQWLYCHLGNDTATKASVPEEQSVPKWQYNN
jgi:hypothetical protein